LLVQLVMRVYPLATITPVSNGAEALNICTQQLVDLLIINNHMPAMGGADLIRTLCARQASYAILMVSIDTSLEAAALATGADRVLRAPFDMPQFRQAVTR
jgi:CheY-like chemotaxis protein